MFLVLAIPPAAGAQSVSSYLQYPNYRGMLWIDQSQAFPRGIRWHRSE